MTSSVAFVAWRSTGINEPWINATHSQFAPGTHIVVAFDPWSQLAALSTLSAGVNDGAAIQSVVLTVADTYYGLTGPLTLNAAGDGVPSTYEIWDVVPVGAADAWILAGNWYYATDSVTWINTP